MTAVNRVSYAQIAHAAGVSKSTVFQVLRFGDLHERITKDTSDKVTRAAAALGWVAPKRSSSQKPGGRPLLGIVGLDRLPRGFGIYHECIQNIAAAAATRHWDVLPIALTEGKTQWAAEKRAQQLVGAVLLDYMRYDLDLALNLGIPSCFFNARIDHDVDQVYSDDAAGVRIAVAHLIELGHRRIAWLCPSSDAVFHHPSMETRRGEFSRCLASGPAHGIQLRTLKEVADQLATSERVTAIITYNEEILPPLLTLLSERNLRVPNDVSLIGHGHDEVLQWIAPGIDSISVPVADIADRCVALIHARATGQAGAPFVRHCQPVCLTRRRSTDFAP